MKKMLRYSSTVRDQYSQIIKTLGIRNWCFTGICIHSQKKNSIK
jgi:hypothetical protein